MNGPGFDIQRNKKSYGSRNSYMGIWNMEETGVRWRVKLQMMRQKGGKLKDNGKSCTLSVTKYMEGKREIRG